MDRDLDEINVIPLVDVMLVLLVIVLTTASFIATGQIPVDLAEARQTEQPNSELPLILSLKADGSLYLGTNPIVLERVAAALSSFPRTRPVILSADRSVVLDRFVQVVDEIKRNGFRQVSLEVERSEG